MERKIKELLAILLVEVESKSSDYDFGLCWTMDDLVYHSRISKNEYILLRDYVIKNKPYKRTFRLFWRNWVVGKNISFTKHPAFIGCAYWWTTDDKGRKQRILFLKHLISKLK